MSVYILRAQIRELLDTKIHPKFDIIIPSTQTEMVTEGRAMSNCIGGYWEHSDWKQGSTELAFIHCDGKPYIDLEFREGKICQARYCKNETVPTNSKDYALCEFVTKAFAKVA